MKKKAKTCYAAKGLPKVPGKPKGTDIVPAWLTPGEAILSPAAAEMLGRGNVQRLNQQAMRLGTPQYKAMGGMVDDAAKQAEAKRITDNPNQYNLMQVQAAQAFMQQQRNPQEPQYFMGGTAMVPRLGTVQPGYYAGGTDFVDELARQGRALVPKGPLVSQPYGSVGPGQGFPVQPSAINTGPVSMPKPPPTFNGKVGGFSVGGYEPFNMPSPQPSALSNARGAINTGATPIGDLASSAAQRVGSVGSQVAGAAGNLAKNALVGAARVGPAAMGIEGAARGLNTSTEDYAKRIGIDTPSSVPGQLGVRALGVLSDVGASGLGMLGIDQRGKFADVAAQRAQQAGIQQATNPILGRPAQADSTPGMASALQPPRQQAAPLGRVGDRLFADQASANAARSKIEADMKQPGYAPPRIVDDAYPQNQGGLYASRAQVPGYLATMARDRAATPQSAAPQSAMQQPRLGSLQGQNLPAGWTQADMDRNDQMNSMARAFVSPQAMRIADIENAGKYWDMVNSLKAGLDNPVNSDDARRSYAAALGGFNGVNQRGTESAASMINNNRTTDATNQNSNLDYSAKMSELGAGQGLRDAQTQEAMAKAANFQTDANLQQAMMENPERYAGMRLGSRGTGGQAKGLSPSIRDIEPGQQPYMVTEQGAVPLPVLPTFQQFSSENPNIPVSELRKRYDTLRQRFSEPGLLQQLRGQQGQ